MDRKFWTRRGVTAIHDNDVILRTIDFRMVFFLNASSVASVFFTHSWLLLGDVGAKGVWCDLSQSNCNHVMCKDFCSLAVIHGTRSTRAKFMAYDYFDQC